MKPISFTEFRQLLGDKPKHRIKTESQKHWKTLEKWLKTDEAKKIEQERNEIKY